MKKTKFISLFSGAGGLDLGFEQAGWECSYASDIDAHCVDTLNLNKGRTIGKLKILENCQIEKCSVSDIDGRSVLAKSSLKRGEVQALVGGPPCQSWSSAGHQLGFNDPRGQLFRDYVRLATQLDVRWLVFENVRGLLTARGPDGEPGSALQLIRMALLDAGFQTEVNLLNAADFGVPQRRVRLFMIGFRRGDRPQFPEPTHSRSSDLFNDQRNPWISLGKCLNGIRPISEEEIIRPSPQLELQLRSVPEGTGLRSEGKREATRPGGHWGYRQGCFIADLHLPARTVTASSQQDWIRDPIHGLRRISPRECAAIQSFPAVWNFSGGKADQYRQIGNAVPVSLAKSIAEALGAHIGASFSHRVKPVVNKELLPLRQQLASAIEYTRKEERRNGESRKTAPSKRRILRSS